MTEAHETPQPFGLASTDGLGLAPERAAFEAWLMAEHLLDATWNADRNCYDEFPAHLAWKAWRAAWCCQQASIDRLMLEWCPDEMTPHQMAGWAKAQVATPGFDEAALDAALKA